MMYNFRDEGKIRFNSNKRVILLTFDHDVDVCPFVIKYAKINVHISNFYGLHIKCFF